MVVLDQAKQKDISLEVMPKDEFTLSWPGWSKAPYIGVTLTDSRKRTLIREKAEEYQAGINHVKITEKILTGRGIKNPECESRVALTGVSFARAFYDGTSNTGKIVAGLPVVLDTVTGECVTGINEGWSASEYKIIGIALENFEELPDFDTFYPDSKNIIEIKLEQPIRSTENVVLKTTDFRIPGRFVYNNKTYAGMGSASVVSLEDSTEPNTFGYKEILVDDPAVGYELVYNLELRDIRPNSYMFCVPYKNGYLPVKVLW